MFKTAPLSILVLAHDLDDPAIERRVAMLRAGGANVTIAGFRRRKDCVRSLAGCPVTHWGRTKNGAFLRRILSIVWMLFKLPNYTFMFQKADIVLARNLEMLALGVKGRSLCSPKPLLVYECLDIHRLLAKDNRVGRFLRHLEGKLAAEASLLITSSPAFVSNYFETMSEVKLPHLLIENKVFPIPPSSRPTSLPMTKPWRIGWFGIIRCTKSLDVLKKLADRFPDDVEIIIRGRPAPDLFGAFDDHIKNYPNIKFLGPYKNPDDLAEIYSKVHFSWVMDFFEQGLNSEWLLPNRLYEGSAFDAVPLAFERGEIASFLRRKQLGVICKEPLLESLTVFFNCLTEDDYKTLKSTMKEEPMTSWVCDPKACQEFVLSLKTLLDIKDTP